MIIDEIKSILESKGYEIDSETISRIQVMLDSIRDDNQINKLNDVIEWFNKKREESDMIVEEIDINDLDKWSVEQESGNISHESGGFFEVIGVKNFNREVFGIFINNTPTQKDLILEFEETLDHTKQVQIHLQLEPEFLIRNIQHLVLKLL